MAAISAHAGPGPLHYINSAHVPFKLQSIVSSSALRLHFCGTKAPTPTKKSRQATRKRNAKQTHFGVPHPLSSPPRLQERRDEAGDGGGRAPVAAALRALRAPPHRPPGVAGRHGGGAAAAAAAGDARRGGVHAAGRVHGADALRLGHLHARLLPHALGRRPRLPLPLRRLRHQPLRDLEGHPPLALRLGLAQGGILPMAYIFQAFIHVDVKPTTK